jgi:hypothetical protein
MLLFRKEEGISTLEVGGGSPPKPQRFGFEDKLHFTPPSNSQKGRGVAGT